MHAPRVTAGRDTTSRIGRAIGTAVLGAAAAAGLTTLFLHLATDSWAAASGPAVADPADLVLTGIGLIGAALAGWLGLGTVAQAMSVVPGVVGRVGGFVAERIAPAALRRAVAFVLGTSLVAAFAPGTAAAAGVPSSSRAGGPSATLFVGADGPKAPDPAFRPTRPPAAPTTPAAGGPTAPDPRFVPLGPLGPRATAVPGTTPTAAAVAVTAEPTPTTYLVRRGDTLWSIAARHLPAGASNAQVAAAWPRWYAANRAVIGADPDLIRAGQRLVVPTGAHR